MSGIFREYDIRGIYPDDLDEEIAYKIGRAIVAFLDCRNVVIGKDMRSSSDPLFESLSKGITDQGADVIDIGMCTTPMLNFSLMNFRSDAGIMITASHNPKEYNGFKIIKKDILQLTYPNGINEIENLVQKDEFADSEKGRVETQAVTELYAEHIMSKVSVSESMKVVIDAGNGVGGIPVKLLFERMGIEFVPMFFEPDGNFPNHEANPAKHETLKELQARVVSEDADLGIAFDGDSDRAAVIDENGQIVENDLLAALLFESELIKHPGEKIYYDLRMSHIVPEEIQKNGGVPVVLRVGNPFYKEKLFNEGGLMAAELSGHIMYRENFNMDDGLFAALKLMSVVADSGKKLSELIDPLRKYFTSKEINLKVRDADVVIERLEKEFSLGKQNKLDGLTVEQDEFWFNLRKSNTEPLVRLRIEAKTKEKLEEMQERIVKFIS